MDRKKLLAELYGESQPVKEKPNLLRRGSSAVRDYFGPIPLIGAVLGAGTVYLLSFAVGSVYEVSSGLPSLLQGGDWREVLSDLPRSSYETYQEAKDFASQWASAGAIGGQFLAYRTKNFVAYLLAKLR